MSESDPSSSQESGFIHSLRALSATSLELVRNRIELLAVEWQEERERGKEVLILAIVGALFLSLGLLLLAFFVVVLFWDSYRLTAIAAVTLLYLGTGVWAVLFLRRKIRKSPAPFSATLNEFANDLKALRRRDEDQR